MKIIFLPRYTFDGASSRYRTHQYIPFFEKEGIECIIYPFFDNQHINKVNTGTQNNLVYNIKMILKRILIILKLKKGSIVFIEKEIIPYFPCILEYILKIRKIKFILDYDDAVIHNYDNSPKKMVRFFLSKKIPRIQKWASAIINGSNYLLLQSLKNNKDSYYIPTSLDINKYKNKDKKTDDKTFTIGWIGSRHTSQLITPFIKEFEDFCKQTNSIIHLIGFNTDIGKTLNKKYFKIINWNNDTEVNNINNFDIGISPSADTIFARGKCAFKSIQYMACSKPVITSPIGANKDVVVNNSTGFHALEKDDWIKFMQVLYTEKELRQDMGEKGRIKVENEFTIQKNYSKYIEIFKEIQA